MWSCFLPRAAVYGLNEGDIQNYLSENNHSIAKAADLNSPTEIKLCHAKKVKIKTSIRNNFRFKP